MIVEKYFNDIGIRVFKPILSAENAAALRGLSVLNSHFFTRYNERLKLELVEPLDKVKHYFVNNPSSYGQQDFDINGRQFMIGAVKTGYTIGETQYYGGIMWWVNKTFYAKDTANKGHKDTEKELIESLQKQIKGALNADEFDENKYYYLADILKGLE